MGFFCDCLLLMNISFIGVIEKGGKNKYMGYACDCLLLMNLILHYRYIFVLILVFRKKNNGLFIFIDLDP
jgi:hypothetical protein